MATITDQAKDFLPSFQIGNLGIIVTMFIVAIVISVIILIITFVLIKRLKFNKTITILEDVSGSDDLEPIGKDKAMVVKVGKSGTELLFLKKRKVYKGSYGKRMGKNKYYFAIGPDGYWYNITLGSLKEGMNVVSIKPTAVNMRYQNESLSELIKGRYEVKKFWDQYGQLIINIAFFMIIAVMFWLYFSSFKEAAPALTDAAKSLERASDTLSKVVGGLDSLRASGGVVPA